MINYIILGSIILILIIAIILLTRYIVIQNRKITYNKKIEELNSQIQDLQIQKKQWEETISTLKEQTAKKEQQYNELTYNESALIKNIDTLKEHINTLNETSALKQADIIKLQESANEVYENALRVAQEKMDLEIDNIHNNLQKEKQECENEYLNTVQDYCEQMKQLIADNEADLKVFSERLREMKAAVYAAVEDQKRQALDKEAKEFYQLQISELDLKEIQKIREILSYMRNERPLCKAIWESYYRTPCNDLISRIIDKQQTCGIYKITNLLDSKIYIGQAVNLSERIKTHIKAGLGIDTPNSILYKAMKRDGVENFSFEIMEYCTPQLLNEKEKLWIDYFSSQDWGYNMTSGGSKASQLQN